MYKIFYYKKVESSFLCRLTNAKNYFEKLRKIKKAAPRFELGVRALQAPALPLGHAAINLNYNYKCY